LATWTLVLMLLKPRREARRAPCPCPWLQAEYPHTPSDDQAQAGSPHAGHALPCQPACLDRQHQRDHPGPTDRSCDPHHPNDRKAQNHLTIESSPFPEPGQAAGPPSPSGPHIGLANLAFFLHPTLAVLLLQPVEDLTFIYGNHQSAEEDEYPAGDYQHRELLPENQHSEQP